MEKALQDGISQLVVFEDDCVAADNCLGRVQEYLRRVKACATEFGMKGVDDCILLGTCGCYSWRSLAPGLKATNHFNGSHAYSIGQPMMLAFVRTYLQFLAKGNAVPVDGILSLLLQAEERHALCPAGDTSLFAQNRSIPSYVVSEGTELRKD
jgi:hypothetical protein